MKKLSVQDVDRCVNEKQNSDSGSVGRPPSPHLEGKLAASETDDGQAGLLPCPFCGQTELAVYPDEAISGWRVHHRYRLNPECHVRMWGRRTREEAIKQWNTRVHQPPEQNLEQHYAAFQVGWDEGFQEAQKPDRFPYHNRCEVRYQERFGPEQNSEVSATKAKGTEPSSDVIPESVSLDACHDFARLRNAFLMAYDLAGIDAMPLPEALPESAYVPGYMDKVRELREVFALCTEQPSTSDVLGNPDRGTSSRNESKSSESKSTLVTVDEVSKALEELREMFPNTWVFVADRATWTQGCESPTRSAVIEIERKENAFFGTTLSEAMKRVRVSKEQDNAKS